MTEVKEIRSLTGIRGIAAVYVVMFHYFPEVKFGGPFRTLLAHGYLAVDLFFILSGFVMALNYARLFEKGVTWAGFRTFLERRIARVYPLYFAGTVCSALFIRQGWLKWPYIERVRSVLLPNLAMVQTWAVGPSIDAPGWSISAEWAAYLLFPLALFLAYDGGLRRTCACIAGALVVIFALSHAPASLVRRDQSLALLDLSANFHAAPVWRCLPEFTLGIAMVRLMRAGQTNWASRRGLAVVLVLVILVLATRVRTDFWIVLLFPLLILALTSPVNLVSRLCSSRPMYHLGLLSYSIYLIHFLLEGVVRWVHDAAELGHLQHAQTVGAIVALLLTYGFALLAYNLLERPGRDVVRRLLGANRTPDTGQAATFAP